MADEVVSHLPEVLRGEHRVLQLLELVGVHRRDRVDEVVETDRASRQEGELVTVAEAEPDGRSVPGHLMQEMADEAAS